MTPCRLPRARSSRKFSSYTIERRQGRRRIVASEHQGVQVVWPIELYGLVSDDPLRQEEGWSWAWKETLNSPTEDARFRAASGKALGFLENRRTGRWVWNPSDTAARRRTGQEPGQRTRLETESAREEMVGPVNTVVGKLFTRKIVVTSFLKCNPN